MEPPAEHADALPTPRAAAWRLRRRTLRFGPTPLLMGIVNVTPDSFSDGGRFLDAAAAIDRGRRLIDEGAAILDVGGESTRPYSAPVSADEQLRRVMPVLQVLCAQAEVPVSIDTSHAQVAREAIDAGAEIVNDVTALTGDPGMAPLAAAAHVGVCAMHMQGTPQTMQDDPRYDDVVEDVFAYLARRRDALEAAGIAPDRICLDPGIGFGKTHQHNLTLLARIGRFHALGCPLLVGHSRKGFLARILADKTADRGAATVGVGLALARAGVQVLRVHEVRPMQEALRAFAAVGGIDGRAWVLDGPQTSRETP